MQFSAGQQTHRSARSDKEFDMLETLVNIQHIHDCMSFVVTEVGYFLVKPIRFMVLLPFNCNYSSKCNVFVYSDSHLKKEAFAVMF